MSQENITAMSTEQLEALIQDIGKQQEVLKAKKAQAQQILSGKITAAGAAKMVENLDDEAKAALLQAIQSSGMASEGTVKGLK